VTTSSGPGWAPSAFFDHFVLQARFGGLHAFTLGILFEELLAGGNRLLVHLDHALFGTSLQISEGFHQFFIGQR
jgi:hypothetical protein